ncbi:MAG TPA: hypothetical protein VFS48_09095, partial [Solirubrobacterales bacterium]|nr:hypothetical protein [Solirubrobacterales bacterium]
SSVPAEVQPVAKTVSAPTHRLSQLAEEIRRNSIGTIPLPTDRLLSTLVDPAPQAAAGLLGPLTSKSGEVAGTGVPPSPAQQRSAAGTANLPQPQPPRFDLFSGLGAIAPNPVPGGLLAETGGAELEKSLVSMPRELSRSLAVGIANAAVLTGVTIDRHRDGGGPAPSNVPLPAPESPATAVADSGGTSFVPIVALLALLALVAPAALRRLGRAADFRAPLPFVCALERPG